MDDNEFPLTVSISIEEWAVTRRRLRYLEAVLVQVLRDKHKVKEWYSGAELASLGLAGIPRTRQGVSRLARASEWRSRIVMRQGQEVREFHCTSLPGRAFDALIDRIVAASGNPAEDLPPMPPIPKQMAAPAPMLPKNTAPPWVLPLLRVLRQRPGVSVADAVTDLPKVLPSNLKCPTVQEVREVLDRFGFTATP